MKCVDVMMEAERRSGRGRGRLSPEAQAHVRQCSLCAVLFEDHVESEESEPLDQSVRTRILDGLVANLKPVPPVPSAAMLVLSFLASFVLLAAAAISMTGGGGMTALGGAQNAAVLIVLGGGAAALATALSREMVPGEGSLFSPGKAVATIVAALVLSYCLLFPWRVSEPFAVAGWNCTKEGLLWTAPAVALFLLVLRRGAVLSHGAVGALIGAFAGLSGIAALHFQCAIHNAPHLTVWHAGVPLACAAAGFLAGKYLMVVWPSREPERRSASSGRAA